MQLWNQIAWPGTPVVLLTGCVALDESLYLLGLHFPHLSNGYKKVPSSEDHLQG